MGVQQALCKHGRQYCAECRQWKVTHPCGKVEFFNSKPLWATFDPMLKVEQVLLPMDGAPCTIVSKTAANRQPEAAMSIENILLNVLGDINDALKSDLPPPEKLAMMRRAKLRAEQQYDQHCQGKQAEYLEDQACSQSSPL